MKSVNSNVKKNKSANVKVVLSKKLNQKPRFFSDDLLSDNFFKEVYVIDCGDRKDNFVVLDVSNKRTFILTRDELIVFPEKHKKSLIIIEHAHFCKRVKSKAQILSDEQRLAFLSACRSNKVTFKLFPETQTPKARDFAVTNVSKSLKDKNETNDTLCIFFYLNYFYSDIFGTLQDGDRVICNESAVAEGKDLLALHNDTLQLGRNTDYSNENDKIVTFYNSYRKDIIKIIENFCEENQLNERYCESIKDYFDVKPKVKKVPIAIYTILSTLINNDGIPLNGKNLLGWKLVKNRVLCFNSNKGGIGKSNLNQHRIKSRFKNKKSNKSYKIESLISLKGTLSKISKEDYMDFVHQRGLWNKCSKRIFSFSKKILEKKLAFNN